MNDTPQPRTDEWDAARRQIGAGRLSVIMPAHNLGAAIAGNVRHVHSLLHGRMAFEIVVVDDGSTDDTRRQIEAVARELPTVRPVFLPKNMGKGAALREGFLASRGNFVLLLDADLDLPPRQAAGFFDILEREKADIVIGSKRHPDSNISAYPWHRRLASAVYYCLVKFLVGLPIRDTQTGIKLFRREALAWAVPRLLVKRFAFDLELLAIAHERGFRVAEAPVTLEMQGAWQWLSLSTVKQVMNDTLAIFYRLRIRRYYQTVRPDAPPTEDRVPPERGADGRSG